MLRSSSHHSTSALAPNEIWYIDICSFDILVRDFEHDDTPVRPWFVQIMDGFSYATAGFNLDSHTLEDQHVINALLHAMMLKPEPHLTVHGIPKAIYVDGSKYFRSARFKQFCSNFGINVIHTMPYMPPGKGKIERMLSNLERNISCMLVPNQPLTLGQFKAIIEEAILRYQTQPHPTTKEAPYQRWHTSASAFRDIEDTTVFDKYK